jgi:hypothetical protein
LRCSGDTFADRFDQKAAVNQAWSAYPWMTGHHHQMKARRSFAENTTLNRAFRMKFKWVPVIDTDKCTGCAIHMQWVAFGTNSTHLDLRRDDSDENNVHRPRLN